MAYLFLGIIAVGVIVLAANAFLRANPATLARTVRLGLGYSALALAGLFALFGRLLFAAPLAWLGFMLLGRGFRAFGGFPGTGRSQGQTSRVRTSTLEMILDHDTGEMDGAVLAGTHAGARLKELGVDDLVGLWREIGARDTRSRQLLEAFLDRMHKGWRELAGVSAGAGEDTHRPGGGDGGPMTREEACEILGVAPGASRDDIRRAHRQLMKKLHPDQGGSNYLAAKVNEAKDLLLGTR